MNRPRLSRALASRIRGAQSRLEAQIQTHIWAEKDIPEIRDKLEKFDADPVGWSERHYPSHGPDSYPVQTHICRSREALERKLARRDDELRELAAAQDNLQTVEEEVLEQAKRIRPTTITEPWPKPVKSIEAQAIALKRMIEREQAQHRREQERQDLEYTREEAREAERRDQEDREARRRHVAKGPEHVIIHQMTNRFIKIAFEKYKSSPEYSRAQNGNWAGGLIFFVTSQMGEEAGAKGAEIAREMIVSAKRSNEDLWDVCRRNGFWTPDGI
ncbi:hypothetical protein SAMN04487993_10586 [Salipiger marinus]|uniref:Uncharacterized protein n=1 Tax=Salipiger marinus TaxID=555512 RepID=A0A1G8V1J8_9RHOB|nr:hypothetical protein SAMN04487993_10586 [Salipiger marinus]